METERCSIEQPVVNMLNYERNTKVTGLNLK